MGSTRRPRGDIETLLPGTTGREAAGRSDRPSQRQQPRLRPDPRLALTPAFPTPPQPGPARPRAHPPPDAGTPRRRAGTRGCCSGTRSRSAAPGRPATHSVAERAGRLIRSLPRAAPISAPCPHPEVRPGPEVTLSNRAPASAEISRRLYFFSSPAPAPTRAVLLSRPA